MADTFGLGPLFSTHVQAGGGLYNGVAIPFTDPHHGEIVRDGKLNLPVGKFDATAAPTVNDDSKFYFSPGSIWVDVAAGTPYILLDATAGAANWFDLSAGGHTRLHTMTSTSDHSAGNWKVFYSNGSGQVVELALGASGTYLGSNGASSAPSFTTPAGGSNHNIFSTTHSDTTGAASPVRGDLIYANSTPAWAKLPKPTITRPLLWFNGSDVAWSETSTAFLAYDTNGDFIHKREGTATAWVQVFGTSAVGSFAVRHANGTIASPTKLLTDDLLGQVAFQGYGTAGDFISSARIKVLASEDFDSATERGARFVFQTTPIGSGTAADVVGISDVGVLSLLGSTRYITWGTTGVAAPNATSVSAGTKLLLYGNGSSGDHCGLGINTDTLWFQTGDGAGTFKWYEGATLLATLGNAGDLTLASGNVVLASGKHATVLVSRVFTFHPITESMASGALWPTTGVCVGESGEHGTYTAIRAKVIAGTAGTGTNTIVVEADDDPSFPSATTLFTLNLGTSAEADDTGLDNAWASGDIFVRARCTAVGATAPKEVTVLFYIKERAEVF